MRALIMLNKDLGKQTLVAILLLAAPAAADPPGARAFRDWRLDCPLRSCPIHTAVAGADGIAAKASADRSRVRRSAAVPPAVRGS